MNAINGVYGALKRLFSGRDHQLTCLPQDDYDDTRAYSNSDEVNVKKKLRYEELDLVTFPFSSLPLELLGHVFTFLDGKSKLEAASVCKTWRHLVFTTPNLWRTHKLRLCCNNVNQDKTETVCVNQRAYFYTHKVGRYLHELSIVCQHACIRKCPGIAVCFGKLADNMDDCQLTSFKIKGLYRPARRGRRNVQDAASVLLTKLLMRQRSLRVFKMVDAVWSLREGVLVLDALVKMGNSSIETLKIDGFFQKDLIPISPTFDPCLDILSSLALLTTLSISYCYLNDNSVISLAHTHGGQLKNLRLVVKNIGPFYPYVSEHAWQTLREACPAMKVELRVSGYIHHPRDLTLLLDPALRVVSLRMHFQFRSNSVTERRIEHVVSTIIRNYRRSLRRFDLDLGTYSATLDYVMFRLARKCKKLKTAKVSSQLMTKRANVLLKRFVKVRKHITSMQNKQ